MQYQVYYMKPSWFSQGIFGKLPNPNFIDDTHAFVKTIEAETVQEVWVKMQAENWSPIGEARSWIESLRLEHTSMTVGDIAIDENNNIHLCAPIGWRVLGRKPETRNVVDIINSRGVNLKIDQVTSSDDFVTWTVQADNNPALRNLSASQAMRWLGEACHCETE